MADKKQHSFKAADPSATPAETPVIKTEAAPVGNATGLRVGAFICWIAALGLEVLAYLMFTGTVNLKFMPTIAQLWKKSNRIKPASKANKVKFWLWNNMGFIAAVVAFLPFLILVILNKDADKRTKIIAIAVAAVFLIIGGAASYDYDPVSLEDQQAAMQAIEGEVYWTQFGKVYHTHDDCQALNRTDELTYGTVEQAIAANRTRLCSFCAKRDNIEDVRKQTDMGIIVVSHYERFLDYVHPQFCHIMVDGRIVAEGGYELAQKIDKEGYEWLKEMGVEFAAEEEPTARISLETCAVNTRRGMGNENR